jgi:proteasome lid subunit RPN8/RPN11
VTSVSTVIISFDILDAIFESGRRLYPRETILMLRGKKNKDIMEIVDLVIPPFSTHGQGFANFPFHMLPMDFSIVGTVHSHPSGNVTPSTVDLNHFFGRLMMIVGYPFQDEQNVAVYNSEGKKLQLKVTKTES